MATDPAVDRILAKMVEEQAKRQLEIHAKIFTMAKAHVDQLLEASGVDPYELRKRKPDVYYDLVMSLSISVYQVVARTLFGKCSNR